jgi:molybdenum cofactor cytidylyltransferase
MSEVAAVILAAGLASRYRAAAPDAVSKVVALLGGKPLVRHVADAALGAGASPVVVVTGHAAAEVRSALVGAEVFFAHNDGFAEGMAGSLKSGIAALPHDVAGALIMLADMPRVSFSTLKKLIAALEANPTADAVLPVAQGRRGNPALLARSLFRDVMQLSGDAGARHILNKPGLKIVEVEAADDVIVDIDTPDALLRAADGHWEANDRR